MIIQYLDEPDMCFFFSMKGSNTEVNAVISYVMSDTSSFGLTSPILNVVDSVDMKYIYETGEGGFSMGGISI